MCSFELFKVLGLLLNLEFFVYEVSEREEVMLDNLVFEL